MKTKNFLSLATVALATSATLMSAGAANAGSFTYTASTGSTLLTTDLENAPLDFTAPLPKFVSANPQEKLSKVTFSITGEMLIKNLAITSTAAQTAIFNYTQEAKLSIASSIPLLNLDPSKFPNLKVTKNGIAIAPGDTATFSDLSASDTFSFVTEDPADLALFEGSGTIDLTASTQVTQILSGGGGNGIASFNTLAGATATITYDTGITPQGTPEPSAVVALGAVSLGFVGLLRKKA